MLRAPRARIALASAVLALFAAGIGCTLSDEYSSQYGVDSGLAALDASVPTDAAPLVDAASVVDSGQPLFDAGADVDAGPYGDFCDGIPEFVSPVEGGTVTATELVVLQVPGCIRDLAVYLDSNPNAAGTASLDGGVDGSVDVDVTISIPTVGSHVLNVNAWNHTTTPHKSPHIGVTRLQ